MILLLAQDSEFYSVSSVLRLRTYWGFRKNLERVLRSHNFFNFRHSYVNPHIDGNPTKFRVPYRGPFFDLGLLKRENRDFLFPSVLFFSHKTILRTIFVRGLNFHIFFSIFGESCKTIFPNISDPLVRLFQKRANNSRTKAFCPVKHS